jgi:hypothetical protein
MRRLTRPAALMGVAAALTFGAACGDDAGGDDSDESSPSTTVDATTTSTTVTPEEAAKATYLEFVETVDRLVTTNPDPDDPDLGRLAVEPVLGTTRDNLTTMRSENQIWIAGGHTSHRVTSVELTGLERAVVLDCNVEDDKLVDRDDETTVRTAASTRILQATLVLQGGAWAVSTVETLESFDGAVPCDG